MERSYPPTMAGRLFKKEWLSLHSWLMKRVKKEGAMTTRHLVDPELVAMLDQFPAVAFTDETLGQARAMIQEMNSQTPPGLPDR